MKEQLSEDLRSLIRGACHVLYHLAVISLSAGIALALPVIAEKFLNLWTYVRQDDTVLLYVELALANFLIILFNYFARSTKDRALAQLATNAGLTYWFSAHGQFTQKRTNKLKARHGIGRNVMIIGSTGYKTLADPKGDLHEVLKNSLEAKILLLNPYSEGARTRTRSLDHAEVTLETLRAQVRLTLDFLKSLKKAQKSVKLKLYSDEPHVKLAILGEHIWLQHYHTSVDIQTMPEYVFTHNQKNPSLYTLFYEYFLMRWEDPDFPEYDLETDELVYRDRKGIEREREPFYPAGISTYGDGSQRTRGAQISGQA